MKIEIYSTVYDGSMGDGWKDQTEAAKGFAKFYTETIKNDLVELFPNDEIIVDCDVLVNTLGGNSPQITCRNFEKELEVRQRVDYLESDIWDKWCNSEEAIEYWEE